ncbi:sodium and chloride-dependent glycine transporter 2-like [Ixodes scapularis]
MCVFKGIKTSGKIVYVTALGPFLILGIMFIRGITLKGASAGLHYYFVPEWNKVLEIKVWKSAAEQVFYSLSIAEGMIICFGGFNEFRNELHKDVVIIAFADFIVSMLSGVVVFSVLGNMAHVLDLPVEGVVQSGIGLAFIAYPQALSMIPYPHFWSAAFFAMLFFLAIDTEFSSVECVVTPFKDEFPILRKHPSLVYFLVCLGMCICGMPMATQVSGNYPAKLTLLEGIGLAFIAYPQALSMIPYPHFWSAAFFAMLFFLAIDTEFSSVECVVTPFKDEFPILRKHPSLVYFLVCLGMCICGMPMATQGGLYILTLMDTFIGGEMLPWIGLAEILAVVFGYGLPQGTVTHAKLGTQGSQRAQNVP